MNPLLPFEWIVATRFMREGRMQTLLIVGGVALGVSVIVFISALISGLQSNLFRRTLDFQAQIIILPPEEVARPLRSSGNQSTKLQTAVLIQPRAQRLRSVDQWQKVRDQLLKMNNITVVAPVVSGAGFVIRADANRAVTLTGIEPESYLRLIALKDKIIAGSANVTSSDIVVGVELAKDMGVAMGDKLTLRTASGGTATLMISGIFDFGNKGQNQRSVYVAFRTAQSLLNLPGGASSLEVNVADPFSAETIAQDIQSQTGLKAESWISTNAQFFSALAAQSMSNTIIRFFVGLTAALGIASVLVVSVVQKSKEIGLLRATGTSRRQVLRIFLLQGALMGLMGSVVGSLMGWGFLSLWRGIAKNADGTPLFVINFDPMLFFYAAFGATLVGTLAAVFPALRAARLDPAVAIRG
ncbi:MAG: ABC transporter permease [Methylotenera sp.]|nr:ABC transporter permease [Methylotenera sp.]